jgi:hypothetical protein
VAAPPACLLAPRRQPPEPPRCPVCPRSRPARPNPTSASPRPVPPQHARLADRAQPPCAAFCAAWLPTPRNPRRIAGGSNPSPPTVYQRPNHEARTSSRAGNPALLVGVITLFEDFVIESGVERLVPPSGASCHLVPSSSDWVRYDRIEPRCSCPTRLRVRMRLRPRT